MTAVICIDNYAGIGYNKRRQTRDAGIIRDAVSMCKGGRIVITPTSEKLFAGIPHICAENPLSVMGKDDLYYAEFDVFEDVFDKADTVVIYSWNRAYPADVYFQYDPEEHGMTAESETLINGTSHDDVIKRVFVR